MYYNIYIYTYRSKHTHIILHVQYWLIVVINTWVVLISETRWNKTEQMKMDGRTVHTMILHIIGANLCTIVTVWLSLGRSILCVLLKVILTWWRFWRIHALTTTNLQCSKHQEMFGVLRSTKQLYIEFLKIVVVYRS